MAFQNHKTLYFYCNFQLIWFLGLAWKPALGRKATRNTALHKALELTKLSKIEADNLG